ncbi:uncharacterized protein isoform X2 [Leptinotarsa decemlineata]|uniref:uncharacterized protein isoform X2 n=1 Tax=Leptinotarsa decemlineata TaxID=7539 RepID=UPI003D30B078
MPTSGFINIDRFEGFDLDTTQLILRDMALFHAVPLALRMKKPEVFRNYIEPYCSRFREGQDIMDPMIRASEAVLKENKAVASWAYKVNESFYKPRCASREPFVTLIHTDLWTNNTMQKFVDRKPVANKFIDFQGFYYGSPASDLLFFLWSSVPKEVLELHFDDLIKYYYDHFIKAVNDHSFIDSRLNFQNFMREIEIEFEYEFGHALVYCLTVVSSKAGSRNMNELGTPEDYLKRITLKEKENAWFIVRDSERRGWLKK